jgi:cytochrome c-type biogenesis protein CcmH
MILWMIFASMTVAAILAVLWPLARRTRVARAGSDLLVYQDQLEEISRDRTAGLIGEAEAEAARVEVSRRLLSAADEQVAADIPAAPAREPLLRRRAAAIAALLVLALVPVGLYVMLGSPNLPGEPAFARLKVPQSNQSIDSMISQVEQHLEKNPNDAAGWEVIAPVYMRLGRFDDAVAARRKVLTLAGESAPHDADLGEALVAAANGVVTAEAKGAFESALKRDPKEPKARFFIGLADEQDGNREAAAAKWRAMLEDSPADAPWLSFVRQALARVTGEPVPDAAAGPSTEDMAAAANMNDEQRAEMIRGMVVKLADRLHADGSDVDGWLRLVRAYVVLGDRDKAKSAADDARRALSSHPDEIKRIDDLAKGLGLAG